MYIHMCKIDIRRKFGTIIYKLKNKYYTSKFLQVIIQFLYLHYNMKRKNS
jgi:hypothetical protein